MAHTIPRFIHHPHSPLSVLLPPPTTTPSLFSNHHHHHKATVLIHCPLFCLTHTHGVDGMCLCGCSHVLCVVCVDGMHMPSHRPHTQPQPLWLCPSPHHHSLVCVWMETRATWPCPTTNHSLSWRGLLAFFTSACNQALCHPPCVCVVDWWLACVGVATCVSACVLVGCVAFHHTVCRVCLHALIHLCHHTLLLLCCLCCWW